MIIKRNSTTSAIICVVALLLIWGYGRPIGMMLSVKWDARTHPELWVVPQSLPTTAAETSVGKSFSYFGYEFESPWTEVAVERKTQSAAVLNFFGGQAISVFDWRDSDALVQAMKGGRVERESAMEIVFGKETMRSNYDLTSRTLNVTPGDLRIFSSRQKMVGNSILLKFKEIQISRVKGRVYSFQAESFRGFQKGDPLHDDIVTIEAFDAQDHKIELLIGAKPNTSPRPTQADINRILYSLRPVSTTQVK
jgi:hypothetical protein